jgi:hypothetical protein
VSISAAPRAVGSLRQRLGSATRLDSRFDAFPTVVFAVVLVGGLALRLLALRTAVAQQDSDSAVIYLMARHAAHGDYKVFFWGQFYGGTLLPLTASVVFRIVGSSFAALQVVEITYWLVACLLLRSVVAAAAGRVAGDLAGAFLWLGAPFLFTISFSDAGFYTDGLVIALATVRLAQGARGRPANGRSLAVGFCLGLAFWTDFAALALAVPAAVWFGLRIRTVRAALAGIAGIVIGAAPWLYETKKSDFATLRTIYGPPGVGPVTRFFHVFTQIVPANANLGPNAIPISTWGQAAGIAVLVVAVGGVCAAAWCRNLPLLVISPTALIVPVAIVASSAQVFSGAARYATFVFPGLAAILAWALTRTRAMVVLGTCLALALGAWTITTAWDASNGFAAVPHPAVGPTATAIGTMLQRQGRTAVWADYQIAYLITAATQEHVIAAEFDPRRNENYTNTANAAPKTTVIVLPGMRNENALRAIPGLPTHHRTTI